MEREIVIGSDLKPKFNSKALWEWAKISENSIFYIIENDMFDVRIYITKKSNERETLKKWLSNKSNLNNDSVQLLSFTYLFNYMTAYDLKAAINNEKEKSFKEGYKTAQLDIRKSLGM